MIRCAAEGDALAREEFARAYSAPLEAYFSARWRSTPLADSVGDAIQEVFLDLFRSDGALRRADEERSFRGFLLGVSRNIALRIEQRTASDRHESADSGVGETIAAREDSLSTLFDREWARSVMRRAAELQAARALVSGSVQQRRVELLRLRFDEGLSILDIASLWQEEPARLHHEYARAREDFRGALLEVVGLHDGSPPEEVEAEAERLIALVSRDGHDEHSRESGRGSRVDWD